MGYRIELSRLCVETAHVQAATRDDALRRAMALHPGYKVEEVVELGADGEVVAEHVIHSHCGVCGLAIWQGAAYAAGDDMDECAACADPATLTQSAT